MEVARQQLPQVSQGMVLKQSCLCSAGSLTQPCAPRATRPAYVRPQPVCQKQNSQCMISTTDIIERIEAKIRTAEQSQSKRSSPASTGASTPSDIVSATCLSSFSSCAGTPPFCSVQLPACAPSVPPPPAILAGSLRRGAVPVVQEQPEVLSDSSEVCVPIQPAIQEATPQPSCVPSVPIQETNNDLRSLLVASKAAHSIVPSPPPETCAESVQAVKVGEMLADAYAVNIGGQIFDLGSELGRGAFGVVREAIMRGEGDGKVVAVKASKIQNVDVVSEFIECHVLQRLNRILSANSSEATRRVPQYLAHCREASEVTLAMTKVAGCPLDSWLYGTDGSDGHQASLGFAGACSFATSLLSQMVPVFVALQPIAFHRDISGHNFMIEDSGADDCMKFTMIDFGLAVETLDWKENWRTSGIGGDPRYWSPAHLSHILYGASVMENQSPVFARLYQERLDHYSFGVLLLELVFGLWNFSSNDARSAVCVPVAVVTARVCWKIYWARVHEMFEIFQLNKKDSNRMRQQLVASRLPDIITEAHTELCYALRAAAMADFSCPASTEIVPLLIVATEFIDPASTLSWGDVPQLLHGNVARFLQMPAARAQHQPVRRTLTVDMRDISPIQGVRVSAQHQPVHQRQIVGVQGVSPSQDAATLPKGSEIKAQMCRRHSTGGPAFVGSPLVHRPRSISRGVLPQSRSSLGGLLACRTDILIDTRDVTKKLATMQGMPLRSTVGGTLLQRTVGCRGNAGQNVRR